MPSPVMIVTSIIWKVLVPWVMQRLSHFIVQYQKTTFVNITTILSHEKSLLKGSEGFPDGTVVKNPHANAGDTDSSPGPGRSHMPQSS